MILPPNAGHASDPLAVEGAEILAGHFTPDRFAEQFADGLAAEEAHIARLDDIAADVAHHRREVAERDAALAELIDASRAA